MNGFLNMLDGFKFSISSKLINKIKKGRKTDDDIQKNNCDSCSFSEIKGAHLMCAQDEDNLVEVFPDWGDDCIFYKRRINNE